MTKEKEAIMTVLQSHALKQTDLLSDFAREEIADEIISISNCYNIDAKIIGRVEESHIGKRLTIRSEFGTFEY